MSNNDFMLEKIKYENSNLDELLRKAEDEDNMLALSIAKIVEEEARDKAYEEFDNEESIDPSSNVDFIVYEAEWNKVEEGRHIFSDFNRDTNIFNNHVELNNEGGGKHYKIIIEHGYYGEDVYESGAEGLKNAKEKAKRKCIKLAADGKLGVV